MLFWIFVIALVIGIGFIIFAHINSFCSWTLDDVFETIGCILIIPSIVVIAVSLIGMIVTYIDVDGYVCKHETRYEQLVYEYENDIYDNDNDVGKKELMDDIREWNEDLAWNKTMQRDFWIGIFIPNIYDDFEFIEINKET